jgi:hypothetical protein
MNFARRRVAADIGGEPWLMTTCGTDRPSRGTEWRNSEGMTCDGEKMTNGAVMISDSGRQKMMIAAVRWKTTIEASRQRTTTESS